MHRTECCVNCKHYYVASGEIPCHDCINSSHWEPNSFRVFDIGKQEARLIDADKNVRVFVDGIEVEQYEFAGFSGNRMSLKTRICDPDRYTRMIAGMYSENDIQSKATQCGFTMTHAPYMKEIIDNINKGEKNKMIKITIGIAERDGEEKIIAVNDREIFHGFTKIEAVAKYLKIHTSDAKKLVYMEEVENWKEFE